MRKFVILLSAMLLLTCSGVHAEEKYNYEEEIKMFEDFYQHPNNYSFQNKDGKEINQYILSKYDDFEKKPKSITIDMMKQVGSVVEDKNDIQPRSVKTKMWKKLKVYYKDTEYVQYDFIGKVGVDDYGKIKYASGYESNVKLGKCKSYKLIETHTIDVKKSKVCFKLNHYIISAKRSYNKSTIINW